MNIPPGSINHNENADDKKGADFSVGDIFYMQEESSFNLYKVLAIDEAFNCYHVLAYSPLDQLPPLSGIDQLPVFIFHSPFDKGAFSDASWLAHMPLTAHDLIGYHAYLRETQDPHAYIPIANDYYNAGLRLTDEKKYDEAIDAYSKAFDLFPPFYEAIDNRAFCKMDLGMWPEAIEDFRLSLEQNPNSLLAEFSIGECYLNMGVLDKAKQQFEIAQALDPDDLLTKQFLDKVNARLKS